MPLPLCPASPSYVAHLCRHHTLNRSFMPPSFWRLRQLHRQMLTPLRHSADLSALDLQTHAHPASALETGQHPIMVHIWPRHTQQQGSKSLQMPSRTSLLQNGKASRLMNQHLLMEDSLPKGLVAKPVLQICLPEGTLKQMIHPPHACTSPLYPLQPSITVTTLTVRGSIKVSRLEAAKWLCIRGTMTMASVTLVHRGKPMRMRELHSKPLRTCNIPSGRASLLCVCIYICMFKFAADAEWTQANKPDLLSSSTCLKSKIV